MIRINILDIIKTQNAIIHRYGIAVYDVVKQYIDNGKKVILSFEGLKNITSGFCNASIGKLYSEFSETQDLLSFEKLDNYLWKEKVKDAIFLAENPDVSEIYASAVSEPFSEYNAV